VTGALKPELPLTVTRVHDTTKMNTGQIESDDLREHGVTCVERIHKLSRYVGRTRETCYDVLVIWTRGDRVGKVEEFRILRRRIEIPGRHGIVIFCIQCVP
jgi:hypothetical protein